ncbi:MAG: hypothetical protein ABSD71_14225 [Bacteroidales bacterium]|jgi:hypothetical protein
MEPLKRNKIIVEILQKYYQEYPSSFPIERYFDSLSPKEVEDIQNILTPDFLISLGKQDTYYEQYKLTNFGQQFLDSKKSISEYFKEKINEIAKSKQRKEHEDEKLSLELKLDKWKVKTFWWLFFIGLFGGFYSGYSLIYTLTHENVDTKINKALEIKLKDTTYLKQLK